MYCFGDFADKKHKLLLTVAQPAILLSSSQLHPGWGWSSSASSTTSIVCLTNHRYGRAIGLSHASQNRCTLALIMLCVLNTAPSVHMLPWSAESLSHETNLSFELCPPTQVVARLKQLQQLQQQQQAAAMQAYQQRRCKQPCAVLRMRPMLPQLQP